MGIEAPTSGETEHVLTLEPVYTRKATYVRPVCSCQGMSAILAYVTKNEAKAAHDQHLSHIGGQRGSDA